MKQFIREVKPYVNLYRDDRNGLAWIGDGNTGMGHSCHPNISATGSVSGMKNLGYWAKSDKIVKSHGWQYNISRFVIDRENELDLIVAEECECQECLKRRLKNLKAIS